MIKTDFQDLTGFYNEDNKSQNIFQFDETIVSDKGRLSDPIFKSIGYPSKIFYKNIQPFINAYTTEGAVVLDSCAGSGSTGLAALLEKRKCLLVDSSPQAINMAYNILNYVELNKLEKTYKKMIKDLEHDINDIYYTKSSEGYTGYAEVIISSNSYECPECKQEIILYKNETGQRSEYKCPHCNYKINISHEDVKKRIIDRRKPIEVKMKITDKRSPVKSETRDITLQDIEIWNNKLNFYNKKYENLWEPDEKIVYNRAYPRKGGWPGFPIDSKAIDLFPKNNLLALKIVNSYIEKEITDIAIKDFLKFIFTETLFRTSSRLFTTSGIKNVYHIPPLGKEQNVLTVFKRKYKSIVKGKDYLLQQTKKEDIENLIRIVKGDAKNLDIPDNSIDYAFIDPPYGGMVPYAELNLFYSAWLNEQEDLENEIIIPMDYEKKEGYVELWGEYIEQAFGEVYRTLKNGSYFTIVFHSTFNTIWNELRSIMTQRLGFEFVNIIESERATTFHTNQLNDTNPVSAFITYRKPLDGVKSNAKRSQKSVFDYFDLNSLEEGKSFREIQSNLIFLAHEHSVESIPSDEEIKNWLEKTCKIQDNIFTIKK